MRKQKKWLQPEKYCSRYTEGCIAGNVWCLDHSRCVLAAFIGNGHRQPSSRASLRSDLLPYSFRLSRAN